jgi:hypothetical protein
MPCSASLPRSVAKGDHVGVCAGVGKMISEVLPLLGFVDGEAKWILRPRVPPDEMNAKGTVRSDAGFRSNIGATGFEPATFRPPAECATRLRHAPRVLSRPILRRSGRPDLNRRWELGRLQCYQLHHARRSPDYRFGVAALMGRGRLIRSLSEQCPNRSEAYRRPPAMAIGADNFALLHLGEYAFPVVVGKR